MYMYVDLHHTLCQAPLDLCSTPVSPLYHPCNHPCNHPCTTLVTTLNTKASESGSSFSTTGVTVVSTSMVNADGSSDDDASALLLIVLLVVGGVLLLIGVLVMYFCGILAKCCGCGDSAGEQASGLEMKNSSAVSGPV